MVERSFQGICVFVVVRMMSFVELYRKGRNAQNVHTYTYVVHSKPSTAIHRQKKVPHTSRNKDMTLLKLRS